MNPMDDEIRKRLNAKRNAILNSWEQNEGGHYWDEPVPTRLVLDKSRWKSNGCYPLDNTPMDYQQQNFEYETLADDATLKYDCFMPTGETYEFLPCAPWRLDAKKFLGYQKFRGTHRIVEMEGPPAQGHEAFVPYKLLLYKGRDNQSPGDDDRHRFVYLAENKPREPAVGDCFIRLEEIHKRMKGTETEYAADCAAHIAREDARRAVRLKSKAERRKAKEDNKILQRGGEYALRFRCWTVDGNECAESENRLHNRLFHDVCPANDKWDHFDVFRVWAELLRKSQGDKLAAKDFFGRYWDAVIPNDWVPVFQNGFRIIVGAQWFQNRQADQVGQLDYENPEHREIVREEVYKAVQRAIHAPRLKFKPPLTLGSVFFDKDLDPNANDGATGWFDEGWRCLDGHPGGLYHIVVNLAVRQFLCLDTHKKPFWQEGYGHPLERYAKSLNDKHLDKCRPHTMPTTTLIDTNLLSNLVKKRNPTQDRCVANAGYSANLAMSGAFPSFYPKSQMAKKRRVAEWLHRSAFSYGGYINDTPNNSQTANNLVLGTPDTNTVMMRYEAFVKRLVIFSNNGQHRAIVNTEIQYPALENPGGWMGDDQHRYTWLAANLKYRYYSIIDANRTIGHVDVTRSFFPFNRESCLLFQSILDKSVEEKCWGWKCWDANRVVVDALLESTVVDGDKEELNKEELKGKLKQATDGDQEGLLQQQYLELVVQQNLAS